MRFAVIGKDVSKSVSPEIHTFIAKKLGKGIVYDKISVPEEEFERSISAFLGTYDGVNVTIPYKLAVMPYLKAVCGDAKTFGAVNTVKTADLTGYNTDGLGFALMLKNNEVDVNGKKVLLLGAGGAGRSAAKKLLDGGAEVYIYDKNTANARTVANEFKGVKFLENIELTPYYAIINATGVGMHKTEGVSPVDKNLIALCEVAVDLIYVPKTSEFLKIAKDLGKKAINGEAMLFYQAYYADCIFFDLTPSADTAKALFEEFSKEKK